jgi:hypothetical protein
MKYISLILAKFICTYSIDDYVFVRVTVCMSIQYMSIDI